MVETTTRTRRPECACRACADLVEECGEVLFGLYSSKLTREGWAGLKTPAERAYIRAHRRSTRKPPQRRTPSPPVREREESAPTEAGEAA